MPCSKWDFWKHLGPKAEKVETPLDMGEALKIQGCG